MGVFFLFFFCAWHESGRFLLSVFVVLVVVVVVVVVVLCCEDLCYTALLYLVFSVPVF